MCNINRMVIKILDLFAGVGGLSLGFELVKNLDGQHVFELYRAVEMDKFACQTLRRNYGAEKVIEGDLTTKKVHKKVINDCKNKVSIVVGGIPCQSFSLIGTRSGYGKHNGKFKEDLRDNLYKEFKAIVKEINPKILVIENVKGILSKKDAKGKKIIDNIIRDFEKQGYNFSNMNSTKKYMLLNAADFGVPQKRERVILIGINKNWKTCPVPELIATHKDILVGNNMPKDNLLPRVTLFEAIGDLPKVKPQITNTGLSSKEIVKLKKINEKINSGKDKVQINKDLYMSHLSKISASGKNFFDFIRPNKYGYINHHVARSHQLSDIILFANMKEGETAVEFIQRKPKLAKKLIKYKMDSFKDKYRKQCFDYQSTTVFAHLEKDGNRFIHPTQARTYTPREAARIQSFPDDFIFEGPMNKKFKQIGNAVPPILSFNIAKNITYLFE